MNEKHNHVTRDIKPLGQCPGCDDYHNSKLRKIRVEAAEEYFNNDFNNWKRAIIKSGNPTINPNSSEDAFNVGFDKGAEEMAKIKDAQIEKLVAACNELLNNYWIDDQNPHNDPTIERVYLHQLRKALENFRKEVK